MIIAPTMTEARSSMLASHQGASIRPVLYVLCCSHLDSSGRAAYAAFLLPEAQPLPMYSQAILRVRSASRLDTECPIAFPFASKFRSQRHFLWVAATKC